MGQLDGKVAFVTGAARGQGRSHAALLASEGADIIGLDLCAQVHSVQYPMSTPDDLQETVRLVEKYDRRMVAVQGDVRNREDIKRALDAGLDQFGHLDIVLANAGIMAQQRKPYTLSDEAWHDSIDIMLTGTWYTMQAVAPILIEQNTGGAIVITSSTVGLRWTTTNFDGGYDGYNAAKYALVGLMRGYAGALAKYNIRVNTVHPTGVSSPMIVNDFFPAYAAEHPDIMANYANALPIAMIEPADVSRVVLFLVADITGKYITGQTVAIDGGQTTVPPMGGGGVHIA
jgi:SDR family mycofactocin-dependent oxidoreductase